MDLSKENFDIPKKQKNVCLEYTNGFSLEGLSPEIGNIFRVFIPERFFLLTHTAIIERKITGTTFYTPDSDLACIAIHCGCLLPRPNSSGLSRKWCTIKNYYDAICSEDKYNKVAEFVDIPQDLVVKGLLCEFLIDYTCSAYVSTLRNGIKSRHLTAPTDYSIRIANYKIITIYDAPLVFSSPEHYIRESVKMPTFKLSSKNEISIEYSPMLLQNLFSAANIKADFFEIYNLYFDIEEKRYFIRSNDNGDFTFGCFTEMISALDMKRSKKRKEQIIVENFNFYEIKFQKTGIEINGNDFSPISDIILIMKYGKVGKYAKAK